MRNMYSDFLEDISDLSPVSRFGRVVAVQGLLVTVGGLTREVSIGDHLIIDSRDEAIPCEVVGFAKSQALVMPLGRLEGVGPGCRVDILDKAPQVHPCDKWLGRVVNALGEPIDHKGPIPQGAHGVELKNPPPSAHTRRRLGQKMDLGVRVLNHFVPCCQGQRLGIFAGSGVGKSVMMSMMARHASADVTVIGLIGERGREVQEFLEDDLGPEGLARSVVVVSTSDEPPLMRRQAAYLTLSIAEYFRDQGKQVLCLMDSVTRFAMACREIGLSAGEPPTTKGYTPSVFSELPKLLERAGPGAKEGAITGLFTVLVEGDDHNEPIADAVRGILDGHVVLSRSIAERGRYPAVDVLKSLSRSVPGCLNDIENKTYSAAREVISNYEDMAEMIRLGAYEPGSDPDVDTAMALYPRIEEFLRQDKEDYTNVNDSTQTLSALLGLERHEET